MTPWTRTIRSPEDWASFCAWLGDHTNPYPFRMCEGEGRTLSQNALFHLYFSQISAQRGDVSADQVKGEMHRRIGLPIRLKDERFAWIWDRTGADMPYEKQCSFLASGILNVSSGMSTKQLNEYIDALVDYASQRGWALTVPEGGR